MTESAWPYIGSKRTPWYIRCLSQVVTGQVKSGSSVADIEVGTQPSATAGAMSVLLLRVERLPQLGGKARTQEARILFSLQVILEISSVK